LHLTHKTTFMRTLITAIILFTGLGSYAQAPDFDKLLILYADEEYVKCIKAAEKYMSKDEFKREPMPYFYTSRAYYEISKDGEFIEKNPDYKRSYNNAISFAAKFSKKDKEKIHQNKEEVVEYFEIMKGAILEDVDGYMHSEKPKYSKCVSELKKLVTFAPEDVGGWLMKATCNYKNKNAYEARNDFAKAEELIKTLNFKKDVMHMNSDEELSDIKNWDKELKVNHTARLLMHGLIESAQMQIDADEPEKAKEIISMGKQWYEEVEEYMAVYNEIVNL